MSRGPENRFERRTYPIDPGKKQLRNGKVNKPHEKKDELAIETTATILSRIDAQINRSGKESLYRDFEPLIKILSHHIELLDISMQQSDIPLSAKQRVRQSALRDQMRIWIKQIRLEIRKNNRSEARGFNRNFVDLSVIDKLEEQLCQISEVADLPASGSVAQEMNDLKTQIQLFEKENSQLVTNSRAPIDVELYLNMLHNIESQFIDLERQITRWKYTSKPNQLLAHCHNLIRLTQLLIKRINHLSLANGISKTGSVVGSDQVMTSDNFSKKMVYLMKQLNMSLSPLGFPNDIGKFIQFPIDKRVKIVRGTEQSKKYIIITVYRRKPSGSQGEIVYERFFLQPEQFIMARDLFKLLSKLPRYQDYVLRMLDNAGDVASASSEQ